MSELPPIDTVVVRTGSRFRLPKINILNVLGELFLTAGALILLFLGWQLWFNDLVVGASQSDASSALSEEWSSPVASPATSAPTETAAVAAPLVVPSSDAPAVVTAPAASSAFANLIVPRLGADYRRTISSGVGLDVINNSAAGIGHYPESQLPGELGNFALAAHRTTYGKSFHDINNFVPGDHIFIETEAGWYRYVYRNSVYVYPTGVDVLNPVPQFRGSEPGDRIITLTSCNPYFSAAERIIAYGVYDAWFPRAGGMPNELSELAALEGN
jgi:sortase A